MSTVGKGRIGTSHVSQDRSYVKVPPAVDIRSGHLFPPPDIGPGHLPPLRHWTWVPSPDIGPAPTCSLEALLPLVLTSNVGHTFGKQAIRIPLEWCLVLGHTMEVTDEANA